MTARKLPLLAAGLAVLCGASAAHAQDWTSSGSSFTWNNPYSATYDNMLVWSRMGRSIGSSGAKASARATPPASTTTFKAGRRTFVERMPAANRAKVGQLMPVCDRLFGEALKMAALSAPADRDDLATSSAFYLEMSRSIYWRGQPGAPPEAKPEHFRGLRHRLKQGYLEHAVFAGKTDPEKQLSHDALVFMACMPALQYMEADKKNDEASKQAARTAAARLLSRFNLTPDSFRYQAGGAVELVPQRGG